MKHTSINKDGSLTTIDETEDGLGLVFFAQVSDAFWNRKEKKMKEKEKLIAEFPYYCSVCKARFKTPKECKSHLKIENSSVNIKKRQMDIINKKEKVHKNIIQIFIISGIFIAFTILLAILTR